MSDERVIVHDAAFEPRADLDGLQRRAWLAGGVAALLVVVGYFTLAEADFYRAYLVGWLFCLSVGLGLFAVSMLGHVTGGDWAVLLRRVSEASGRTLPFFLVAALPIAFNLEAIYPWVDPLVDADGHITDHLLEHKRAYLNVPFFLTRAVIYFVVWSGLAYLMSLWSRRHDETGDPAYRKRLKGLSALGLILYVLSATFASVDWMMSLDPHWFSSLFGVAFAAGHALSAFAAAVLVMLFLSRGRPFAELLSPKIFHDYGKLMLAMVAFWAYLTASQYIIIWSGDLPEEITWYLDRSTHGWQLISVLLMLGHFALPFFVLLSAELKKQPRKLAMVAVWVLLMRWFDYFWLVSPSVSHEEVAFSWIDPIVPVAVGGLWLGLLVAQLKGRAMVPLRDPELEEVVAHG